MQPGDQIGAYTIVSEIGGGGMSVVYLAEDTTDGTRVVVKQLREQYVFDKQLVDRFLRGATAVKDLRHPHLARVLAWMERDGRFYTVEEYLSGGSLADLLKNGPPSEVEALTWCRDSLKALNYVHEFGIVHRDIKPSNLMLDDKRRIHVIDFGIARVFGDARLTRTGDAAIGTPWYMSPEQIRGVEADHLTDVYSAGVVLYELLTGHVPFDGSTDFAIKEKIVHQPPPPMRTLKPGIDPALEKIVFKAMAKDPHQRHGGCGEFAIAIERYLNRKSSDPKRTWTRIAVERVATPVRRAPGAAVAGMIAVVVLLAGIVAFGMRPPGTSRVTVPGPAIRLTTRVDPGTVTQTGTTVRFGYQITNGGNVPLTNVTVVDGGSTPPTLASGDTNNNAVLDTNETWEFHAQAIIEQGDFDNGTLVRHVLARSDQATSEVRDVALQLERRPGIAISTLVNGAKSVQLTAPGRVTYAYVVSNTGNVRLTGVRVLDEQGVMPTLRQGDSNSNNALDVGERWEYRSTAVVDAAALAAGTPVVRRPVAVSDQLRSEPDEVTVRFEPRPVPPQPVPTPRKVRDVPPLYPQPAQAAGIQGDVRIELTIDPRGHVQEVHVVQSLASSPSGPAPQAMRELLDNAAIAAARQWEYAPTGVAFPVVTTANVRFVLTPHGDSSGTQPAPVRVGGNIKAPIKTRHVAPAYPAIAQSARVQGVVIIEATIDQSGRVRDARVLRSIPLLDQAAIDAVRQWEFTPTFLNGVAVPVIMTVTVQFTLN